MPQIGFELVVLGAYWLGLYTSFALALVARFAGVMFIPLRVSNHNHHPRNK